MSQKLGTFINIQPVPPSKQSHERLSGPRERLLPCSGSSEGTSEPSPLLEYCGFELLCRKSPREYMSRLEDRWVKVMGEPFPPLKPPLR